MQCKSKEREKTHKTRSSPSLKMALENVLKIIPSFFLLVVDVGVMCPSNSPATAPENVFDGNNFVGTPNAECCSKLFFPHKGDSRVYIELSGNYWQRIAPSFSSSNLQNKINLFVSPTPPSGCQAQGFVYVNRRCNIK